MNPKMIRVNSVAGAIGIVILAACLPRLQGQAQKQSTEEQVRSQYRIASVDESGIVQPGIVLIVRQNGIRVFAAPAEWQCNTYKKGDRIKESTKCVLTTNTIQNKPLSLVLGASVYVTALQFKSSEVILHVKTTEGDFRGAVSFEFPKGYLDSLSLKDIQDTISDLFVPAPRASVDMAAVERAAGQYVMTRSPDNRLQLNADGTFSLVQFGKNYSGTFALEGDKLMMRMGDRAVPAGTLQGDTMVDPQGSTWVKQKAEVVRDPGSVASLALPTAYSNSRNPADRLQLNTDGTFTLVQDGRNASGSFTIAGDKLTLQIGNHASTAILQGDFLVDDENLKWVRQGATPPPVVKLKLPSLYANAQSPADQLQLNADNSFSLQESGQASRGTFGVNGNVLEISFSETNIKTAMKIDGGNLKDGNGQTWVLRPPSTTPAGPPPAAVAPPPPATSNEDIIKNADIIKMVKAGIDGATIIAKIGSSKCQFDTSTDALIKLKQSGVSAAVLKAVVAAGW